MGVRSVKVSNISLGATEQDLKEFLTFPGKIEYIEMQSDKGNSQVAYVTFSNPEGAETAVLLSGAVVAGQSITIALAPDYALPTSAASTLQPATEARNADDSESGLRKAEDVVSTMLAKGFILGKDALNKAKAFDEKHQFTSTATAKVISMDQKVGLSEKFNAGTIIVNDKVKEMDEKYQVSEKTKSAISAAEQSVSNAGSAIMKNRYILTGVTWATGAYNRVAKAAEEVGQKTREKVMAQDKSDNNSNNNNNSSSSSSNNNEGHVYTIMSEPQRGPDTKTTEPSKPESQQATTAGKPSNSPTTQSLL